MTDSAHASAVDRLFVYGTLGPGRSNQHVLTAIGGDFEAGHVRGNLLSLGWGALQGFPGLKLDQAGTVVHGHVFRSPDLHRHWQRLDAFEGREYRRTLARVTLEDNSEVDAWIYELR